MPNNSIVFILAVGMTIILLGPIAYFLSIDIPIGVLAGLAIFAFIFSFNEFFSNKNAKSILMFFSVPISVSFALLIQFSNSDIKYVERMVNSITVVSLGVTIYTIALKDVIESKKEKKIS